jgi:hypothetical protein
MEISKNNNLIIIKEEEKRLVLMFTEKADVYWNVSS